MKPILRDIFSKYVCFIAVLATLTAACTKDSTTDSKDTRPNILFIMSDDHSERAISAYGSTLISTLTAIIDSAPRPSDSVCPNHRSRV